MYRVRSLETTSSHPAGLYECPRGILYSRRQIGQGACIERRHLGKPTIEGNDLAKIAVKTVNAT